MDVVSLFRRYQPKQRSFLCMDDLPSPSHSDRSCGERADGSAFSRSMGRTSACLMGFVHMGRTAEFSVPAAGSELAHSQNLQTLRSMRLADF